MTFLHSYANAAYIAVIVLQSPEIRNGIRNEIRNVSVAILFLKSLLFSRTWLFVGDIRVIYFQLQAKDSPLSPSSARL